MRHIKLQPVQSAAVAVKIMRQQARFSRHISRHLLRTVQFNGCVASMDNVKVHLKG
jgi:hypothetical protein